MGWQTPHCWLRARGASSTPCLPACAKPARTWSLPIRCAGCPPRICPPLLRGRKQADGKIVMEAGQKDKHQILHGGWRNALANVAMRKAGIPVIESYNETLPMAGMHRDNGAGHECTHFCHPSAPQAWVAALYRTLTQEAEKEKEKRARAAGPSAAPPAAQQQLQERQQQQQQQQQGAASQQWEQEVVTGAHT